jgi:hypothetical protein
MSFRVDEVRRFKTYIICDDCGTETLLSDNLYPIGFDSVV